MLGISGGIFIVPLYAFMQHRAKANQRAQVIAALNIYNSLFMVGSAVLGIICLTVIGMSIPALFLLLAAMNIGVAIALLLRVPIHTVRFMTWAVTHTMYRLSTKTYTTYQKKAARSLYVIMSATWMPCS